MSNARRGFARWLIKTGNGHRGVHGGAAVSVPRTDQSLGICRSMPDFVNIHAILAFFCKSTGELVLTRHFHR